MAFVHDVVRPVAVFEEMTDSSGTGASTSHLHENGQLARLLRPAILL